MLNRAPSGKVGLNDLAVLVAVGVSVGVGVEVAEAVGAALPPSSSTKLVSPSKTHSKPRLCERVTLFCTTWIRLAVTVRNGGKPVSAAAWLVAATHISQISRVGCVVIR